jgi:hypothetical protein
VIRLIDETIIEEKFLINFKELENPNRRGDKQLNVYKKYIEKNESEDNPKPNFQTIIQTELNSVNNESKVNLRLETKTLNQLMTYLMAFISILVLLLPHEKNQNNWITICFTHKLVVSFVLIIHFYNN